MRGITISELNLDIDGSVVVEKLADIFEDGEVVGNSYLASSLRKSVAERGPTPLDTVIRRFNNGYFAAEWLTKGKTYIHDRTEAPPGTPVEEGPRGGLYYEAQPEQGIPDSIRVFERQVRNDDLESGFIATPSGAVLERKTDNSPKYVAFDIKKVDEGLYKGAILTHNHPSGGAFSPDDLVMSLRAGLSECRAVGRVTDWPYYYTYRMRISPVTDEDERRERVIAILQEAHWRVKRKFTHAVETGKLQIAQAEDLHYRVVWSVARREMAKNGVFYEQHRHKNPAYFPANKALAKVSPAEGPQFKLDAISAIPLYGPEARPDLWQKRWDWLTAWLLQGQSTLEKGRVYIKPDQEPPHGFHIEEGPRGGRYYETIGREAKGSMTPRRILQTEFGRMRYDREEYDRHTQLDYKVFKSERGPEVWIRAVPGKDKPWAVTKKSALSLRTFLKSVAFMSLRARNDMRRHVQRIILSPVSSLNDRKLSKNLGAVFTSAATMDMSKRIMHIYPKYKDMHPEFISSLVTHEVGHAVDDERSKMVTAYNEKVAAILDKALEERGGWRNEGGEIPISTPALDNFLEKEYSVPQPHPSRPLSDAWSDVKEGMGLSEGAGAEGIVPEDIKRRSRPPSRYAMSNIVEYFAECYDAFHRGKLTPSHVMYKFFKQWPAMERWIRE